jgi:phage I-like protein
MKQHFSHFICKDSDAPEGAEKRFYIASVAEDGVPGEVQIFPCGEVRMEGADPFIVDDEAMNEVIRRFEARGIDMVFDYEHQTEGGDFASPDGTAPAAGWIRRLINKGAQGLWAAVEWTERAKQLIAGREYRYYSPVFYTSKKDRRLVELARVALTNAPRLNWIKPIVAKDKHSGGKTMEWWKKFIAKLGLKEDATEADVVSALEARLNEEPRVVIAKEVLTALELRDGAGASEVVASIHALRQRPDLTQEVANLKRRLAERDRDDLVVAAMKAGKLTPAQKEWAEDYALRDPEGFRLFVAKSPQVVPTDPLKTISDAKAAGLQSAEEKEICRQLGISTELWEKHNGKGA